MIRSLLPAVFALTVLTSLADAATPRKYAEIKLRTGETLKDVTVTAAEPDGLRVRHDSGVGKVRIEDLPDAVRADFGIDTLAASDFRMRKKLEQDGLDGEAREMKVRLLKETPRLEQDEQQERSRKEIFNKVSGNDYNFAEIDTRLMERAAIWREADRPDLAEVLEADRETLRAREKNRTVANDRSREDELQARIRNLENRPTPVAQSSHTTVYRSSYVRNPYPSSYWNYNPVVVVNPYSYSSSSYCPPTYYRPASAARQSPVYRPTPQVRASVGGSSGGGGGIQLRQRR